MPGDAPGTPGTPSQAHSQNTETPQALKTWWAGFKKRSKKEPENIPVVTNPGIFGVPLHVSIKYANVAISLMNEQGESFIYGYVPIVVAKCGVFLKEKATDVQGIFRLSGAAKRIKELQVIFDSPERYGKGLDWTGYTVHDAANIFRRYLNQLPQPIVPLEFYDRFRDPLRNIQPRAVGDTEAQAQPVPDFDHDQAIITYQRLITELPPLNRQLLLYILDLLAVFASKSDVNLMTSANLAAIFQPGLLSHPDHDMVPHEYRLSQDVLTFLVDNQDSFLIGMSGTAADEDTVREVQSGAAARQPNTPIRINQTALGRSASNGSAGADSARKLAIRRNLSVSSKNSKHSSVVPSPGTPSSGVFQGGSIGVHRSNTVPSKKSPGLSSSSRFSRGLDSPGTPSAVTPGRQSPSARSRSPAQRNTPPTTDSQNLQISSSSLNPAERSPPTGSLAPSGIISGQSSEQLISQEDPSLQQAGDPTHLAPPPKVRKISDILNKSSLSSGDQKDGRPPNKLKKKRMPSGAQASANSSTNSLQMSEESPRNAAFFTPMMTPGVGTQSQADPLATTVTPGAAGAPLPALSNTAPTPLSGTSPGLQDARQQLPTPTDLETSQHPSESTLKPKSPVASAHSKSSVTDFSEQDHNDDERVGQPEKKRRWRFSHSARKSQSTLLSSPPLAAVGSNAIAEQSVSSVGSWHQGRKSVSNDSSAIDTDHVPSIPEQKGPLSEAESSKGKDEAHETTEKKGFFGKMRARVAQAREERKEKEAEKERAKSPPREADRRSSKASLNALTQEAVGNRGRSMDLNRELKAQTVPEQAVTETTTFPEKAELVKPAAEGSGS